MLDLHYNDDNHIKFSWPDLTDEEINEVVDTLKSGWITTGPKTKQFERNIAEFCGTSKAVCLNSATAAEELNLRVLGIGEGDEVIVPAFTYTATVSAVIHCGAKPVMVDIKKNPLTGIPEMDYDKVSAAINENTKAIIPVDLYGILCDYDKLFQIVDEKKPLFKASNDIQAAIGRVAIVDDAAHAIGAWRVIDGEKKNCGQIADFTSFSFHAVKNITSAEGGAAAWREIDGIDNEELYHQYMLLSLHGQSKDAFSKNKGGGWEYDILGPWYKCNMTDILASVGMVQLRRYKDMMAYRKHMIEVYDKALDEAGVEHLKHYDENYSSSGHLYITRTPWLEEKTRNEVIQKLADRHVPVNVHYKPLPMMTGYTKLGFNIEDYPNAYEYYKNLITLPLYTLLNDEDLEFVVESFKEVVQEYR
nr:DegT/DnrJ/EryC1/StrS family aminotransferase [uncultured Butyrivibrio sp.]